MYPNKRVMLLAAAAILGSVIAGGVHARDFTIASWGGGFQDSQRKHFFKPFGDSKGARPRLRRRPVRDT